MNIWNKVMCRLGFLWNNPTRNYLIFRCERLPYSPELNPCEQIWQSIKDTWLKNRCYKDDDDILAVAVEAWQHFTAEDGRIRSLCSRDWATIWKFSVIGIIPSRTNRKEQRDDDRHLYKIRYLVEHAFLHLKQWRGMATRYAQNTRSFLAALPIRCLMMWSKIIWRHCLGKSCKINCLS